MRARILQCNLQDGFALISRGQTLSAQALIEWRLYAPIPKRLGPFYRVARPLFHLYSHWKSGFSLPKIIGKAVWLRETSDGRY